MTASSTDKKATKAVKKPVQHRPETLRRMKRQAITKKVIGVFYLGLGLVLLYGVLVGMFISIYPNMSFGALISPFLGSEGTFTAQQCVRQDESGYHNNRKGFRCTGTVSFERSNGEVSAQPAFIYVPSGEGGAVSYFGSKWQQTQYPDLEDEPVVKPFPWSSQVQKAHDNHGVIWTHGISSFWLTIILWGLLAWPFPRKQRIVLALGAAIAIVTLLDVILFVFIARR
jgi:hypothetical protein